VEGDEGDVQLRDGQVDIIAWIADDRRALAVARQVA
jgi:hypothetical protein